MPGEKRKPSEIWMVAVSETRSKLRTLNAMAQTEEPPKRSKLEDLLSHLEVHGLSTWIRTHQAGPRLLWSSVLLAALTALLYGLWRSASDYYHNPLLTSLHLRSLRRLALPALTLCPSNAVNRSHALLHDIHPHWAVSFLGQDKGLAGAFEQSISLWRRLLPGRDPPALPQPIPLPPHDFQAYVMSLGYQSEAFLEACFFHNAPVPCANISSPIFHRHHGACLQLVPPSPQSSPGVGLSLLINIHTDVSWFSVHRLDLPIVSCGFEEYLDDFPPAFDGVHLSIAHQLSPAASQDILIPSGTFSKVFAA